MRILHFGVAAVAAIPALAAGQPIPLGSDPADPQAASAPVRYESVFDHYRPFAEQDAVDWRGLNDRVRAPAGRSGPGGHDPAGHAAQGHAGPVRSPGLSAPAATAPSADSQGSHAGHGAARPGRR